MTLFLNQFQGIDEHDARNIDPKKTTEQNEFVMLEKNSNAHSVETKSVIFSGKHKFNTIPI